MIKGRQSDRLTRVASASSAASTVADSAPLAWADTQTANRLASTAKMTRIAGSTRRAQAVNDDDDDGGAILRPDLGTQDDKASGDCALKLSNS